MAAKSAITRTVRSFPQEVTYGRGSKQPILNARGKKVWGPVPGGGEPYTPKANRAALELVQRILEFTPAPLTIQTILAISFLIPHPHNKTSESFWTPATDTTPLPPDSPKYLDPDHRFDTNLRKYIFSRPPKASGTQFGPHAIPLFGGRDVPVSIQELATNFCKETGLPPPLSLADGAAGSIMASRLEHPIRSMNYLKHTVLSALEDGKKAACVTPLRWTKMGKVLGLDEPPIALLGNLTQGGKKKKKKTKGKKSADPLHGGNVEEGEEEEGDVIQPITQLGMGGRVWIDYRRFLDRTAAFAKAIEREEKPVVE